MKRTISVLLVTLLLVTYQVQAKVVRVFGAGATGTLIFSNFIDGSYASLYYENSRGQRLDIFDSGLEFNYSEESDPYLSPDKKHFFVNFSETGFLGGIASSAVESKEYMCAFVRMADGCIVRVDTGGICGGKWDRSNRWVGIDGSGIEDLDASQITASNVFADYSSSVKDASVNSFPKILKYLPQGAAFDNLLACDPVTQKNKIYYKELLKLLRSDGDSTNAKKVVKAMDEVE
jgi:hypothetical protein